MVAVKAVNFAIFIKVQVGAGVSVEKVGEMILRGVKFGDFFKIFYPALA